MACLEATVYEAANFLLGKVGVNIKIREKWTDETIRSRDLMVIHLFSQAWNIISIIGKRGKWGPGPENSKLGNSRDILKHSRKEIQILQPQH